MSKYIFINSAYFKPYIEVEINWYSVFNTSFSGIYIFRKPKLTEILYKFTNLRSLDLYIR